LDPSYRTAKVDFEISYLVLGLKYPETIRSFITGSGIFVPEKAQHIAP